VREKKKRRVEEEDTYPNYSTLVDPSTQNMKITEPPGAKPSP